MSSYCEYLFSISILWVKSVITRQYQIFLWRHPVLTQFLHHHYQLSSFLLNRADHENTVKMMKNISFNQIFTPRSRWHEFIFHHHRWMLRYDSTEFYQKRVKVDVDYIWYSQNHTKRLSLELRDKSDTQLHVWLQHKLVSDIVWLLIQLW